MAYWRTNKKDMRVVANIGVFLLCFGIASAQGKYSTKTGMVQFEASVPSFEEVKAKNENASAILNTSNGEFASLVLVKGFRFKVALMEEHFNENYMESSTYPKAIVKGKLDGFSMDAVSDSFSEFMLKGTITVHGVTQPLETGVQIRKAGDGVELQTEFILTPEQFDIKIPKIVSKKIADEVFVTANFALSI